MAETICVPANATLIQRHAPAYFFAFTGTQIMGARSTQRVLGYPIVVFFSIVPETTTTRFTIETTSVPVIAPKPVLFLQRELVGYAGMKLRGWDHVFWMGQDYSESDEFNTACAILREEYEATDRQIIELRTLMCDTAALTRVREVKK